MIHTDAQEPSQKCGEDEQEHEKTRGLIVEEQAYNKKIAITANTPMVGQRAACRYESIEQVNYEEESPEMYLGEQ